MDITETLDSKQKLTQHGKSTTLHLKKKKKRTMSILHKTIDQVFGLHIALVLVSSGLEPRPGILLYRRWEVSLYFLLFS